MNHVTITVYCTVPLCRLTTGSLPKNMIISTMKLLLLSCANSSLAPVLYLLQVPVHVFLDFSTLECRHLSQCVELFVLDLMDTNANYTNREVKVRSASTMCVMPTWLEAVQIKRLLSDLEQHWTVESESFAPTLTKQKWVRARNTHSFEQTSVLYFIFYPKSTIWMLKNKLLFHKLGVGVCFFFINCQKLYIDRLY